MKEQLFKLLSSKKLIINDYLIKVALDNNLSLNEFLVLCYFDNSFSKSFDVELLSNSLGININSTMEAFNSLMMKGLVNLEKVKDVESRYNEIVSLNGTYELVATNVLDKTTEETKEDVFRIFEKELGRTIPGRELEMINKWLNDGTSEEMILGALRQAIYNGTSNFSYIDRIIFEWNKKGFKTMDEVYNHLKNKKEEKNKDREVSKKEQDILDYDWLDE